MVGPLTLKQFVYVAGAGAVSYILWQAIPVKLFAVLAIAPFAGLGLALAFLKINKQPFIVMIQVFFKYLTNDKFYLWHHKEHMRTPEEEKKEDESQMQSDKRLDKDRLHDLAWGLDVLDNKR